MPAGIAAVSAYVRGLDGSLADRLERYRAHLETQPLAAATRRTYAGRVAGFLAWLAELDPVTRRRQGDPFDLGHARDYAVRDYQAHLVSERLAKPSSVNLTLAALDHFFRWVGLGPAKVRREDLAQAAPRALNADEQRRLLRAAERGATGPGGVRDRAVLTVLLFTGLRIAELVALNTGDVAISARKGVVTVRRGKGERYRTVPLNAETREVLAAWLQARAALPGAQEPALWLSLKGARLSTRAVDLALRRLGTAADVRVSAHVLRHTCLTGLVRAGHDIVLVAELAGHARLETTRRYSVSDAYVKQQYDQALAGAERLAGPAATTVLTRQLEPAAVHWLQTNFLKTELELGHCLRLPAEGPCECDLALTCSKFLTSSSYAPRLRDRLAVEQQLVDDARSRGWAREVERHQATQRRIEQLLTDLEVPEVAP